mgnify:CR=1 FL=1
MPNWPKQWYGRDLPAGLVPVVEEEFQRIGAVGGEDGDADRAGQGHAPASAGGRFAHRPADLLGDCQRTRPGRVRQLDRELVAAIAVDLV